MRLLRPKNAVMAAMSQMSSSSKPCACRATKSASSISWLRWQTFIAKSSIARWRGVMSALRWFTATWSATKGFFS
ncbi:hypothetical protein D3C86_2092410 [compost metagenome]